MSASSHRFFTARHKAGTFAVEELPPPPWQSSIRAELRYVYDVLEHALPHIKAKGLHFYFTKEASVLPEYGSHVVSVLFMEERCKLPVYSRHVRATIRNNQSKPFLGFRLHKRMGRLEFVLAIEYLRDWYTHIRSKIALNGSHRGWPEPVRASPVVIMLPLGYHSQEDLPLKPMAERTLDTFFAGDMKHKVPLNSYRYWLSSSKFLARGQAWKALQKLVRTGSWRVELSGLGATERGLSEDLFDSYSEKMMNSRVCTAVRGSMAETFRAFEGMRAGCLVVSNVVPKESYLYGAPVHYIDHWSELEGLLKKYARDVDFLDRESARCVTYWNDRLQASTMAVHVAEELNRAGDTLSVPEYDCYRGESSVS